MISQRQQAIEILKNGILADKDLARNLGVSKQEAQIIISGINRSQNKFSAFSTIRHGEHRNYSRELINRNSNEHIGIKSMGRYGVESLRKLDTRRKQGKILLNTRQGKRHRALFIQAILKQNLDLSVEAQKLLQ